MLCCVTLGACDTSSNVQSNKASQLVLTDGDMPGYTAFYKGPQVQLDNQGTNRSDPSRFGRQAGWIVRFRPSSTGQTAGALVVESRVDLFKDSAGAAADFSAYQALLRGSASSGHSQIAVPGLPQDSIGVTFTEAGAQPIRFFEIAWRDRNVTASVTVEGFDGSITKDQALQLAKKQENHIKGA